MNYKIILSSSDYRYPIIKEISDIVNIISDNGLTKFINSFNKIVYVVQTKLIIFIEEKNE